jgi:hypothetical protein
MNHVSSDAPDVKIIPPLVYLAGIVIGLLASIWMPTRAVSSSTAWTVGGILILCAAVLIGSAVWKFKDAGTTVRPDRAASALVIAGPYRITRNPMNLGMVYCDPRSVRLGAAPFAARIDYRAAPRRRAGGGISLRRGLREIQGNRQALVVTIPELTMRNDA